MKYIKQIIIDIILYGTVYLAYFKGNEYANNFYILVITLFSIIAVLTLLMNDKVLDESATENKQKSSILLKQYCRYSTIFEVCFLAAIGWWYSSVVFLILLIFHFRVHTANEKINGKPPLL